MRRVRILRNNSAIAQLILTLEEMNIQMHITIELFIYSHLYIFDQYPHILQSHHLLLISSHLFFKSLLNSSIQTPSLPEFFPI